MKKIIGKLFGLDDREENILDFVGDTLQGVIERSGLELSFDAERDEDKITIELFGEDQKLLLSREAQLLNSLQLYLRRVLQCQNPEERYNLIVDCDKYRERADKSLLELAEKLKSMALNKGKPVYFRALSPRDRKLVHEYLASQSDVKSRSVGDGLYKKIKISPSNFDSKARESEVNDDGLHPSGQQ